MRILHLNSSDLEGGAARAAYRIHRSMVNYGSEFGLESRMRVIKKIGDDPTVIGGIPNNQNLLKLTLKKKFNLLRKSDFNSKNLNLHSIAWPNTGLGKELENISARIQPDIIHLHWLGDITISIEEIGRLKKPLIWTLHDQWPFCGAEHYTNSTITNIHDIKNERYSKGYIKSNRLREETGKDLNRETWLRKIRSWKKPITIIGTTSWISECAKNSLMMKDWPNFVIPYPIDLEDWSPVRKEVARSILNIPIDIPLILFGAIGGTNDPRKGADLLFSSLEILKKEIKGTSLENLQLAVFGERQPDIKQETSFQIKWLGKFQDNVSLRLIYSAADVMVVPSRQESFGQTASESQACGTPVAAFRTGGLIDVIAHKESGYLADPFNPYSLAKAIRWVIECPERNSELRENARNRAVELWDPRKIAKLYAKYYKGILEAL